MLTCKRASWSARNLKSPGTSSKCMAPPPSMSTDTFGPSDAVASGVVNSCAEHRQQLAQILKFRG